MLRNMASIYIFSENKLLMLYRIGSRVVPPSWCGIGGHFEENELNDPEKCVLRELYEEVGMTENDICNLKLRYIAMRLKNGEIRQNYYFFADLSNKDFILKPCDEGILDWTDLEDVLNKEMPVTAKYCLEHYFKQGNTNAIVYGGIATETGIEFAELLEF